MFELRCTVRNCHKILRADQGGLTCPSGHHFDRAREGYYSLLQPQDRKSLRPGDHDDAVLARRRWLDRGHASSLVDCLRGLVGSFVDPENSAERLIDLGCGDGSFPPALFPSMADRFCGIDLSKRAIKMAAKKWPETTWVWSNADRQLPITDRSVSLAMSLFGRRPVSEIARVLRPNGTCLVAIPAEDDLIELREQTQTLGIRRSRWEKVVDEFETQGLGFAKQYRWQHRVDADAGEVADALAMTYRGVRHSQRNRIQVAEKTSITLAADILIFKQNS